MRAPLLLLALLALAMAALLGAGLAQPSRLAAPPPELRADLQGPWLVVHAASELRAGDLVALRGDAQVPLEARRGGAPMAPDDALRGYDLLVLREGRWQETQLVDLRSGATVRLVPP